MRESRVACESVILQVRDLVVRSPFVSRFTVNKKAQFPVRTNKVKGRPEAIVDR